MRQSTCVAAGLVVLAMGIAGATELRSSTAFRYHGQLAQDGAPASGSFDVDFRLFDQATDGTLLGQTRRAGVAVENGAFAVELDFGLTVPSCGEGRFLEIHMRPSGAESFIALAPRQPLKARADCAVDGNLTVPGGSVGIGVAAATAGRLHVDGTSTTAVYAVSSSGIGTYAVSSTNAAVYGYSSDDYGVDGRSFNSIGVYGQSYTSGGMWGLGPYIGVQGNSTGSDPNRQAVRGDNSGGADGYAGLFYGNAWVAGTLYKNAGAFRIDHPLEPADKVLYHSFVESPDMKNIYDGVVRLDANGAAEVELPAWFEALNGDFRYQLTAIGAPSPGLHVAREVAGNRFAIAGGAPGSRVSWQVTGIRHDPYAVAHRIPVEEDKPAEARGTFIFPEGHGATREEGALPILRNPLEPAPER